MMIWMEMSLSICIQEKVRNRRVPFDTWVLAKEWDSKCINRDCSFRYSCPSRLETGEEQNSGPSRPMNESSTKNVLFECLSRK